MTSPVDKSVSATQSSGHPAKIEKKQKPRKSHQRPKEITLIYALLAILFIFFLVLPLLNVLVQSFLTPTGATLENYSSTLSSKGFGQAFLNSIVIATSSAVIATVFAFFLAYTIHYTNVPERFKKGVSLFAIFPMLLPTITYGFAIIYTFGNNGIVTQLLGFRPFRIYGFNGLLLGYVIYTLPVAFMLLNNTMKYIDKKYLIVSRALGDSPFKTFKTAILRPLLGTLAAAIVQSFFLAFTDYGIPAAIGGRYTTLATILYEEMLGSVPDHGRGAVVAIMMMIPSIISIIILQYLGRFNVRYSKISVVDLSKSKSRDWIFGIGSILILAMALSVFIVILVVPFTTNWPYQLSFTFDHFRSVLTDPSMTTVYTNSLLAAFATALIGTLLAFLAGLITARSNMSKKFTAVIDGVSLVTNAVPGMVLGIGFMMFFLGTPLQNTLIIIVALNIVHYFSTPYLMTKGALEKLNVGWETTAALMGDSWFKTTRRIIAPNVFSTMAQVFSYYFVNAMVTLSGVVFIVGAFTPLLTTKINELQYFNKYNEVFVLSILILVTNLVVRGITSAIANRQEKKLA